MAEGQNEIAQNRSMLRDFLGSITTMAGGDLSNITAPPFVLDTKSTVELPSFWAENPSIFCAPAQSEDPAERALLVLKWFLSSLRNQNYMGHSEDHGVKKPLNAFLGEMFVGKWEDEMGTTKLVSEQVSHHPPITACKVWNDEHGVSASGYTRQTITFSGTVSIKQTGHALFHLSKRDETYLIPLPELRVKGVLSGTPYPELQGKYYITSTSGYTSVINFSGKGWFSGNKHAFEAVLFKESEGEEHPLYTVEGTWNKSFTIHDVTNSNDIETFDIVQQSKKVTKLIVDPLDEQDPWETRRAWADVISNLNSGNMKGVMDAKSRVERGQRQMRKDEETEGIAWESTFFTSTTGDEIAEALMKKIPGSHRNLEQERKDTKGVWNFDAEKWEQKGSDKPYRGEAVPDNSHRSTPVTASSSARTSIDSPSSARNSMSSLPRNSISGTRPTDSFSSTPRSSISQSSSVSHSPRASLDSSSNRTSIDSFRHQSDDKSRKRGSIVGRLAALSPFSHSRSSSSSSSPNTSSPSIPTTSPKSAESSVSEPENTIHKDIPEPQTEQALRSEDAKLGSGIEGMSLDEKVRTENALRSLYSTA